MSGYRYVRYNGKRMPEHRAIAEKVLGRPLKSSEVVHHVNMNQLDNRHSNLLICDKNYHRWLHEEYGRRYAKEHFSDGAP